MPAPKGSKNALGNKGGGRKSLYKPEYAELAFNYCLLGATDVDLAKYFGVSESAINRWKIAHVKFAEALKEGREEADAKVASRLYARALGYSHEDVHVSNYQGAITITPIIKHYPPDTKAATYWLNNRQRARWRDKLDLSVGLDKEAIDAVLSSLPSDYAEAVRAGLAELAAKK